MEILDITADIIMHTKTQIILSHAKPPKPTLSFLSFTPCNNSNKRQCCSFYYEGKFDDLLQDLQFFHSPFRGRSLKSSVVHPPRSRQNSQIFCTLTSHCEYHTLSHLQSRLVFNQYPLCWCDKLPHSKFKRVCCQS